MGITKIRENQIFGVTNGASQAPFFTSITPNYGAPNLTKDLILKGAFFTPSTTVLIDGGTVNATTFVNDNEIKVNITLGANEGTFNITVNNGTEAIFYNKFLISIGEVFIPQPEEWINKSFVNTNNPGEVLITAYGTVTNAEWNKPLNMAKDWILRWQAAQSSLGEHTIGQDYQGWTLQLKNNTGINKFSYQLYPHNGGHYHNGRTDVNSASYIDGPFGFDWSVVEDRNIELRYLNGVLYCYVQNVLKKTYTTTIDTDLRLITSLKRHDYINIQYIELPD
jgi:hypothetical protein